MDDRNEVFFRGTVVSLNIAKKMSTLRLCIEGERNKKNFPLVNIFDVELTNDIKLNQKIEVYAHTQNQTQKYPSGKLDVKTLIVADKIKSSKRHLLNFFTSEEIDDIEGGVSPDVNNVILCGNVKNIYIPKNSNGKACILRLATLDGERERHCDISCFDKQATYAGMIEEGNRVAISGYVATAIKEREKTSVYFQNVICKDISLIK